MLSAPESHLDMKMHKGSMVKSEAISCADDLETSGTYSGFVVHPEHYGVPMNAFEPMWAVFVPRDEAIK